MFKMNKFLRDKKLLEYIPEYYLDKILTINGSNLFKINNLP